MKVLTISKVEFAYITNDLCVKLNFDHMCIAKNGQNMIYKVILTLGYNKWVAHMIKH